MYRSVVFVLLTVCFFVMATHANSEPNFQEGMWEMTMSATMTGLDGLMPPIQAKSCMMKKDLSPEKLQGKRHQDKWRHGEMEGFLQN